MKTLILVAFLITHLFCFQANSQTYVGSTKDFFEVEAIVKKSQQKYEEAKKKVYRAEEKLVHMEKIGILSYNDLTKKERNYSA